jgi:hypothetical protein
MAIIGFLATLLFVLCFAVTSLAVRSLWQFRYQKPLTPVRLFLILTVGGAALIGLAVTNDEPTVVLALAGAVLCASVLWLRLFGQRL